MGIDQVRALVALLPDRLEVACQSHQELRGDDVLLSSHQDGVLTRHTWGELRTHGTD